MSGSKQSGFKKVLNLNVAPTAQGANADQIIGRVPVDGTVESVTYVPNALITGANANTRRLTVKNKKADASGTGVVADLQFNFNVNAPAFVEKTITNGDANGVKVAKGDILVLTSAAVGTGIADPGGVLMVKIARSL